MTSALLHPGRGLITPGTLLEGPFVELTTLGLPRLEPVLAIVLATDVAGDAQPGEVARAIPGLFLAVDLVDASTGERVGLLMGEQLLPLESTGELRLHVDGRLAAKRASADLGDPVTTVGWVAAEVGGLAAGDVLAIGATASGVDVAAGTLLLEGPIGSSLSAVLRGAA